MFGEGAAASSANAMLTEGVYAAFVRFCDLASVPARRTIGRWANDGWSKRRAEKHDGRCLKQK